MRKSKSPHLLHHIQSMISRVINASLDILDHILEHESCDVDPVNRLDGATPLHIAIQKAAEETDPEGKEARTSVVESLLEAGADTQ